MNVTTLTLKRRFDGGGEGPTVDAPWFGKCRAEPNRTGKVATRGRDYLWSRYQARPVEANAKGSAACMGRKVGHRSQGVSGLTVSEPIESPEAHQSVQRAGTASTAVKGFASDLCGVNSGNFFFDHIGPPSKKAPARAPSAIHTLFSETRSPRPETYGVEWTKCRSNWTGNRQSEPM